MEKIYRKVVYSYIMNEEEPFKTEKVEFSAPPAKHGNYYIFHIPNSIIKSGEINPDYILGV